MKVMVMTGGNKSLYLSEETEITGVLIAAEGAEIRSLFRIFNRQ